MKNLKDVLSDTYKVEYTVNDVDVISNIVHTGEEKYGDYTIYFSFKKKGSQKWAISMEVIDELLDSPIFILYRNNMIDSYFNRYLDLINA